MPWASQVELVVKNPPAKGDLRDASLIPGLGRSPGKENSSPHQYSCLENPMDRGAQWATVHRVAKGQHNLATEQQQLKNDKPRANIILNNEKQPHGLQPTRLLHP